MTIINGINYAGYDQEAIDRFIAKNRLKALGRQLARAEKRGFATTKIPLGVLRDLLNLIA